jgi:hypothetical protein
MRGWLRMIVMLGLCACEPRVAPTMPTEPTMPVVPTEPVVPGEAAAPDEPDPAARSFVAPAPSSTATADWDVWGNIEGTSVGDDYSRCGLGRPPSMGSPPEHRSFDSATAEIHAIEDELPWVRENIESYEGCVRQLRRQERSLEAAKHVEGDALADVQRQLASERARLDAWQAGLERYLARIAELEAELEARRALIEAGICPGEPCPPGTVLPGTEMRRR